MELVKNIDGDVLNVRSGVLIAHSVSPKESKTIVCKWTRVRVRHAKLRGCAQNHDLQEFLVFDRL